MDELSIENKLVLVTGGSGFIALHIIRSLLNQNVKVRTTVRSLKDHSKIDVIKSLSPQKNQNLDIREADLTDEKPWDEIVKGCNYVLHVASPVFYVRDPKS